MLYLTEAERARAEELGLTPAEMRIAKATRIPPERYAFHKEQIAAEEEASQAQEEDLAAYMAERLQYAYRRPGGKPPWPEEPPPTD